MADNFYARYPVTSGSGAGVTSLNGETGIVNLVAGTNITIVPVGQNITINSTASGSNQKTEYRTISAGEAAAKQLTLVQTPLAPTEVILDTVGGTIQFYGSDFTVTGTLVDWTGLGLDGLLASGDRIVIEYAY